MVNHQVLADKNKKYLMKLLKDGAILFNRLILSNVYSKYTAAYDENIKITGLTINF